MAIREFIRICKQAGCKQEFMISAPSIEEDRAIGLSEPEYCSKHRKLHARSYSRIACHHYDIEMTESGERLVRLIEQRKKIESANTVELKGRLFDPLAPPEEGFGPGGLGSFSRPIRAFIENNSYTPKATLFQIAEKKDELLSALEDHQVIVLVGTTGSGKSTYVPWLLLTGGEPGKLSKWAKRGPICVTQPRIQATRQVPRFIANTLNGTSLGVGSQIGFSHSNAEEYDRRTRLIFQTDGKLINDIVSGAVSNYSIIMIDEAHERSVNIDLILGLLKDQIYLYPHLRIIIASATINHDSFINFFGGPELVPFIYSEGRRNPITEHWWGAPDDEWWKKVNNGQLPTRDQLPLAIKDLIQNLCRYLDELPPKKKEEEDGHILIFMPGTREIDQTVLAIRSLGLENAVALPLYAQRPIDEQEAALNPKRELHPNVYGKRRVIVSTNVAETSLTVEGVKYVIDTGYIKESYWNPLTQVTELQTVRHSKAGCKQRWGRAGRINAGHAYMLYTNKQFEDSFPENSTPSIARSSLEQVILTAKVAGVRTAKERTGQRVLGFNWMPLAKEEEKRFKNELERAYSSLQQQGALDGDGDLKRFGLELRGMPASLDVTRIFTESERHAMGVEAATLLPFLKLDFGLQTLLIWKRDWSPYEKLSIRQSHLDLVYGCRDDLELYLKLWILWENFSDKQRREWEERGGINYKNFQERIEDERRKLLEATMDWRKAEKRKIAIEKINALRPLIAYSLPDEIYIPVEDASEPADDESPSMRRLRAPDILQWDSYWEEDVAQYEEYDDEFDFDPSYLAAPGNRSGVYRRYNRRPGEVEDSALIEIAPTSVCFGNRDAHYLVACQRRANFRRSARAKVLGMNMIYIDQNWIKKIRGSLVERSLLYSSLSRHSNSIDRNHLIERLFLPWIIERGSKVRGTVHHWDAEKGAVIDLHAIIPPIIPVADIKEQLIIRGWLPIEEIPPPERLQIGVGDEISAEVIGYSEGSENLPSVLLGKPSTEKAFEIFSRRYRASAQIEVEMRKILEDPLGRNPIFIIREPISGLDIPMADSDFCGNTHPQPFYGRRFDIGERFQVDITEIDDETKQVFLSRGRQLLNEYAQIPDQNFKRIKVIVRRSDNMGVYLSINGSAYVGFVRRALWPAGFNPKPGSFIDARLRRLNRQVNQVYIESLQQCLREGLQLPEELDLGVELDLRTPPAYDRFAKIHGVGDIITAMVERLLDNGGLLIALDGDLKGIIFESELGLDKNGNLKKSRDYSPGEFIDACIYQMFSDTATVRCSAFRRSPPPLSLEPGQIIEVRILMTRDDTREQGRLQLTCSYQNRYQVQVHASKDMFIRPISEGEMISIEVNRIERKTNLIQGIPVTIDQEQ